MGPSFLTRLRQQLAKHSKPPALVGSSSTSSPPAPPPPTTLSNVQLGVALPVPAQARYLFFRLVPNANPRPSIEALMQMVTSPAVVVGFGLSLLTALNTKDIPGLRDHPQLHGRNGIFIPSTPSALWIWIRGDDRGKVVLQSQDLVAALAGAFEVESIIDAFKYGTGRDLTGFEDGTENPVNTPGQAHQALDDAAFLRGTTTPGLNGSSFAAVQKWVHDLGAFAAHPAQNNLIGRDKKTNEELEDAPLSAHIKRTQQERIPDGFMVRRSMPWAEQNQMGLVFVAFAHSFDAFEAHLKSMVGLDDDGITDGLFAFSRPVTGSFFWIPPCTSEGKLDLSFLGFYW